MYNISKNNKGGVDIMQKKNWAQELADKTGKTRSSIYYLARKLGRKPTLQDIQNIKLGRPEKYE